MKWEEVRERLKTKDRYYQVYDNPESFLTTLDSKVVAWTYSLSFGFIIRVLYALFGMSNRYEPMPIGNRDHVNNLWKEKPSWVRYLLWRVRNPWEDFRKFYMGFSSVDRGRISWESMSKHFGFWVVDFKFFPCKIPLPYYKNKDLFGLEVMIGWKNRGIPSITIRA